MTDITLDDEQRRWVMAALQKVVPDADGDKVETLCRAVEASMAAWQRASTPTPTFRQAHDQQRELWHLAWEPDPKVGIVRRRFAALPSNVIPRIEVRTQRVWQRILGRPLPPGGLIALGSARTTGRTGMRRPVAHRRGRPARTRPPAPRRSSLSLAPVIDGVVRGVTLDAKRIRAVGRRHEHAADALVMYPAVD
jgi:hypothetical protein